jgi:hypothetical protein
MGREPAKSFEDLIVWQRSYALVLEIYKLTKNFPKDETYGLRSQLILAHDLGYLDQTGLKSQIAEVGRLLSAYIKGIEGR